VVYNEEQARGALGVAEIAVSLVTAVNKADSAHKRRVNAALSSFFGRNTNVLRENAKSLK